jgi:hypothetical protein
MDGSWSRGRQEVSLLGAAVAGSSFFFPLILPHSSVQPHSGCGYVSGSQYGNTIPRNPSQIYCTELVISQAGCLAFISRTAKMTTFMKHPLPYAKVCRDRVLSGGGLTNGNISLLRPTTGYKMVLAVSRQTTLLGASLFPRELKAYESFVRPT